jgi:hypothetical protein
MRPLAKVRADKSYAWFNTLVAALCAYITSKLASFGVKSPADAGLGFLHHALACALAPICTAAVVSCPSADVRFSHLGAFLCHRARPACQHHEHML